MFDSSINPAEAILEALEKMVDELEGPEDSVIGVRFDEKWDEPPPDFWKNNDLPI